MKNYPTLEEMIASKKQITIEEAADEYGFDDINEGNIPFVYTFKNSSFCIFEDTKNGNFWTSVGNDGVCTKEISSVEKFIYDIFLVDYCI